MSKDELPVSTTQVHQISTAVGPADGSVWGAVGLSILQIETAGSADVSLAPDVDEAQQGATNVECAGASLWQEPKLGAMRPAHMFVHIPNKVLPFAHACHTCLSSSARTCFASCDCNDLCSCH